MCEELKPCKVCGEYPFLLTYETVYCVECGIEMDLSEWDNYNTSHEPEVKLLPCGCTPDGNPIFWNTYNGVVQCHKCGAVYDYVNSKSQTASIRHETEVKE